MERQLANLVQEQSSSLCRFEPACSGAKRTGEGATLVSEKFALDQIFRERPAVNADEWAGAPRAQLVNVARDELFACARFTDDEDVGRAGRD